MSTYNNPFPLIPSASRIERIHHCPASLQMERAAPKRTEDTTHADLGNEVHGILSEDVSEDEASASAAQTAEMCEDAVQRLLSDWLMPAEPHLAYMELRYGLTKLGNVAIVHADSKADFVFTGQFDRLYVQGRRGLLVDFKALHGDHTEALHNPQLASLAVLVARRHNLGAVRVALVQPWKGRPTVADYAGGTLDMANDWLWQTLDAATVATPDNRRAGKWCSYCKARFNCDTFTNANINALEVIEPITISGDAKHQASVIFARMASLSVPQLIHIQENVKQMMSVFIASHSAIFKEKVEAGEVPGYGIKQKKGSRKITNVGLVFERAAIQGVSAEAFAAKCKITFKDLDEVLKDSTKAKGKALEAIAAEVLRDATETGKGTTEVIKLSAAIDSANQ